MEYKAYLFDSEQISSLLHRHPSLLHRHLSRGRALQNVIARIRQFLDLDELLIHTISEVRQLLNVDRVGILKLETSTGWDTGTFVAESVVPPFDAALAKRVEDHCFGTRYAKQYQNGKVYAQNDVENSGLSACHLDILRQFQVRANLLAPLIVEKELWGLMCIHQCSGPRNWTTMDIEFAQQISDHLSMGIEHAELMNRTQQKTAELNQTLESLKQAHTRLAQTEKMSGLARLAAGVAHEINNPVTFIQGNLDYLLESVENFKTLISLYRHHYGDENEEIKTLEQTMEIDFLLDDLPKTIKSMDIGTQRIENIVQGLSQFAHLNGEGHKPTDLNQALDNALTLFGHSLQHRAPLKIERQFNPLPKVDCYPALINQVFSHLLENAVDALNTCDAETCSIATPLKITVTTTATAETVSIAISDNGPGISPFPNESTQLFDPFFTTKPVGQGTGLGLAICYRIIQKHQGSIRYQSAPGKETTFTITLPIHQPREIGK